MEKKTILFIGHDLKFLPHIIDHFSAREEYSIRTFHYQSHALQRHRELVEMLAGTDLIFCEWGLGNLSWLSKNKLPTQKLVVRIHAQEFLTGFLKDSDWKNIDQIILVSPHMLKRFSNLFPSATDKCKIIYNTVDCSHFDHEKEKSAIFNIGYLGILPKLKAPHIGLEILKSLKEKDNRYKLFIKSKRPDELVWLWDRPDERKYYEEFFEQINSHGLQDSVIWDPHGPDVQEWFQKIGFILSTSDYEAFHLSVPEGMASGAIPVIRNWEGAGALYPKNYIFEDVQGAVKIIREWQHPEDLISEQSILKDFAKKHYGLPVILQQYEDLFTSLLHDEDQYKTSPSLRDLISNQFSMTKDTINAQKEEINKQVEDIAGYKEKTDTQHKKLAGLYTDARNREDRVRQYQELLQQHQEQISHLQDKKKILEQWLEENKLKKERLNKDIQKKQEFIQQQQQLISRLKEMNQAHLARIKTLDETVLIQQFKLQYLEQKFLNKLLIIGKEQIQNLLKIIRRKLNRQP